MSQVHVHKTLRSMYLWTLLCALLYSHVGRGKGSKLFLQSCDYGLVQNVLVCRDILSSYGHGSDWNTKFRYFGWVSEYFWQYSALLNGHFYTTHTLLGKNSTTMHIIFGKAEKLFTRSRSSFCKTWISVSALVRSCVTRVARILDSSSSSAF